MNIRAFQEAFLADIVAQSDTTKACFQKQGELSAQQRLSIYQHAYRARLIDVLDADFPALGKLLGDKHYNELALGYIERHPSQARSINEFGEHMSHYIRQHPTLNNQPLAIEMADFEWQLHCSFHASDEPLLSAEVLQDIPTHAWPDLRFAVAESANLISFTHNTPLIWQALIDNKQPEIIRNKYPETWLIWRQNRITHFRSLNVDEAVTLRALLVGNTFADICEKLLEWHDEQNVPSTALRFLQGWLSEQLLTSLR